jgi:predicted enzyme related to lactoylglutathione lyase
MSDSAATVFRPGGVSYLRIPADQPAEAAAFYEFVFGWRVHPDRGGFEDASGHVIGHFLADMQVAGEAGVRPYIYVENVDDTLARLTARGGEIVTPPYPEGDLKVGTYRDPAGNVMGIWQRVG